MSGDNTVIQNGGLIVGREVVHDLNGSGCVVSVDEWSVRILFEDGKIRVFGKDNEYLSYAENGERVHLIPKYVSVKIDKETAGERSRKLSKYCTDFEGNRLAFEQEFDSCKNPELLKRFEEQVDSWVLIIGCGPQAYQRVCAELRENGLAQPENYVRVYENGHAEKYDLLVPDPHIPNVDFDLGLFFGYRRLVSTGRYQIGKKKFALRNLLKVKRILEIGEAVPDED